ncbi:hypothetical protein HBH56_139600 [Parastagonospora nodorum]|nr:hypothetical protein HBH56_139600 [Parastagonospora nodorum]KAH3928081.1 hypothetical protein HBH54_144740 [Parastagonospora nodorum]KAH3983543.1 hypothetical protein HBH51_033430 [Parastagonospora nodorum]KAH4041586.1 hypothetical protein HBI09_001820 [Parastagonospora nodorum]KAH4135734.1 hypothetical protein HBH45_143350 [Parastagonospora nodorum]
MAYNFQGVFSTAVSSAVLSTLKNAIHDSNLSMIFSRVGFDAQVQVQIFVAQPRDSSARLSAINTAKVEHHELIQK